MASQKPRSPLWFLPLPPFPTCILEPFTNADNRTPSVTTSSWSPKSFLPTSVTWTALVVSAGLSICYRIWLTRDPVRRGDIYENVKVRNLKVMFIQNNAACSGSPLRCRLLFEKLAFALLVGSFILSHDGHCLGRKSFRRARSQACSAGSQLPTLVFRVNSCSFPVCFSCYSQWSLFTTNLLWPQ